MRYYLMVILYDFKLNIKHYFTSNEIYKYMMSKAFKQEVLLGNFVRVFNVYYERVIDLYLLCP